MSTGFTIQSTRQQTGWKTITVQTRVRLRDQRRVALPQRGSGGVFKCDIGAYEFVPWVVGQLLPRPASGTGKLAPTWSVTGGAAGTSGTYDAWSPARRLDIATRPTRSGETAIVSWAQDDVTSAVRIVHAGIVVWPDDPQLHIAGAPVNLGHSAVTDGYAVAPDRAQAFEGEEPNLDLAGKIVSTNVFTRTELTAEPGDSYTVLQFTKGTQTSGDVKVLAVKTVDWNKAGMRDMRDRDATDGYSDTDCVIGRELQVSCDHGYRRPARWPRRPRGPAGLAAERDGLRWRAEVRRPDFDPEHDGWARTAGPCTGTARWPDHPDPGCGAHDLREYGSRSRRSRPGSGVVPAGQPPRRLAGEERRLPVPLARGRCDAEDRDRQ